MKTDTNDKIVTREDAIAMTFGRLSMESIAEVDALLDSIDFNKTQSAYLIYKLLLRQRILYREKGTKVDPKTCTLIRLRDGLLVGSGWCEKCDGALGRGEY
jgi:hypothetical protein